MATAAPTLVLPDILREHHDDIRRALAYPLPMIWREDDSYADAVQPREIGKVLVEAIHTELVNARIGYVFKQKMSTRDRVILARASKVGGKLGFFSNLDLLIEVNWSLWSPMTPGQRVAVIDHELCHFGRHEDDAGNRSYVMLHHDVEEFGAIVRRWGLWRQDVLRFAAAMEAGGQLNIFERPILTDV